MKSTIRKVIYWQVGLAFSAIVLVACQVAPTGSTFVASPTNSELPTRLPSPTQVNKVNEATVEATPTPSESPATQIATEPVQSISIRDLEICDDLLEGVAVQATPSPAAGISADLDSMFPPAQPAKVELDDSDSGVLLTWGGTGTDVDQFYNVYYLTDEDDCWHRIGIKPTVGDNEGGYEFEAFGLDLTEKTFFAVSTVDIYGNESPMSIAETSGSNY